MKVKKGSKKKVLTLLSGLFFRLEDLILIFLCGSFFCSIVAF